MSDELSNERVTRMRLSNVIAMKDRGELQARDVCLAHRKRLRMVYDRIIGTRKGMGRILDPVRTKNDKPICLC